MLSIVDKPLIQYAAEEAVAAGIDTLIFVIGRTKRAIADHFDKAYELEAELEARGKERALELARILPSHIHCVYLRQAEALGLGHAVNLTAPVVGDEPFAVILADDLIDGGGDPCIAQMKRVYEREGVSVLAVEEVDPAETDKYGIVRVIEGDERVSHVQEIVEKPAPGSAPSNLGVVGRYILTPRIFSMLNKTTPGAGGEIQLTDAISMLLKKEAVLAYRFAGKRYDCGSKEGFLEANVEYALQHPELGESFAHYLRERVKTL